MKVLQVLASIVGLGLLAAAAHVNIEVNGGYGTPHAKLMMAHAAGVGIAALCIGAVWSIGRRRLAVFLSFAIAAGELFGVLQTAERLIVSREEKQAPLRGAKDKHETAAKRVSDAEAAVAKLAEPPEPSQRLTDALKAKATADAAVVEKSAERNCATNCRALLQAQADAANREVQEARNEIAQTRKTAIQTAQNALTAARAYLEEHPAPPSATPLADRLGVPAWFLDLVSSGAGSVSVNGLGFGLLAFGGGALYGRRRHDGEPMPEPLTIHTPPTVPVIDRAQAAALEPPEREALAAGNVVTMQPRTKPAHLPAPAVQEAEEIDADPVIAFLKERVPRVEGAEADWTDIYNGFLRWHADNAAESEPLTPRQFGAALAFICESAGIRTRKKKDGRVYCIDRKVSA